MIEDERTILWVASSLFAFFVLFETYLLNVGYSQYFYNLFRAQGIFLSIPVSLCICVSFYLFYRFIHVSLTTAWYYKIALFLMFMSACLIEFGYRSSLGRFTESFDVENALMTTTDQKLTSIFMYLNYWAAVPCAVFLVALLIVKSSDDKPRFKPLAATFALYVTFFFGFSFFQHFFTEKVFPTVALNAFAKTSADFMLYGPVANGKWGSSVTGIELKRRELVKPDPEAILSPSNNIVLVVDESVRGDHLSLNGYRRETTPFLQSLARQKILHNWGIAAAASTGSIFSFNTIITGLTPDDFPERTNFKINTTPTIFQYAKAMKYQTHFFDGQMKNYWGGIPQDKKWIDKFHPVNEFDDNGFSPTTEIDNRIAKKVKNIISGSKGNLIVIFKHGSHIPYQNNFPEERTKWKPSYVTTNKYAIPSESELDQVINSYDNSILYNVNTFFENLVDDYAEIPNNTVIIYTGDHGQSLFVGGKTSHGGTTKAEANVPLFVIGKIDEKVDTAFRASHQNIFPTVLDLIGYPEKLRSKTIAISLLKARSADSRPRFFNPDLDKKVSFDE
ncbi:MAG: sulfatase-like hydrolase/transferase [Pyrinomonadaceae bacterium]|nr:sulfatase-like hydrolase/transferase [Pyrinomonadaceae bacterium]